MYKCFDCGCVFEQPKVYTEDCTPGGVSEGGSFIQKFEECPECGGAFGSAEQCAICGKWECIDCGDPHSEYGFICEDCLDELEMLENE